MFKNLATIGQKDGKTNTNDTQDSETDVKRSFVEDVRKVGYFLLEVLDNLSLRFQTLRLT